MLRYRLSDVTGIIVNERSLKSLAKCVGFQAGLLGPRGITVPLYVYRDKEGQLESTSEEKIVARLDDGKYARCLTLLLSAAISPFRIADRGR